MELPAEGVAVMAVIAAAAADTQVYILVALEWVDIAVVAKEICNLVAEEAIGILVAVEEIGILVAVEKLDIAVAAERLDSLLALEEGEDARPFLVPKRSPRG